MSKVSMQETKLESDTPCPESGDDRFRWHAGSVLHDESVQVSPNGTDRVRGMNSGEHVPGSFGIACAGNCGQAAQLANILALARNGREFAVAGDIGSVRQETEFDGGEHAAGYFRCMTSGTSGRARTVRRSHKSWIASFRVNQRLWKIRQIDSYAVLGGLCHSLSLYGALEAAHLGADLHLLSGLRPESQLKVLVAQKVSILYATPTHLRLLALAVERDRHEVAPSVRLVLTGGSKLDLATTRSAIDLFPNACIREFYGSAETSFVTISGQNTPAGSVGRAYPGVEIRVGSGGRPDEMGEVWVRSPYLFEGYAGGRAGGARWDGGFLSVGEVGQLCGDGNLYLTGRTDRMVTIADRNVHPEEIERFLMGIDGVLNAAVLPEPDRLRGNRLAAFVRLADSGPGPKVLAGKCRQEFGSQVLSGQFILRNDWPMLPSGKTDLAALATSLRDLA